MTQASARGEVAGIPISIREREAVTLRMSGLKYREIAERMGVSIKTVQAHLRSVADKSRPSYRREAAASKHLGEPLSERQAEIVVLIGQGYTIAEISEQMDLSTGTVATYFARAKQKLGKTRQQIIDEAEAKRAAAESGGAQ